MSSPDVGFEKVIMTDLEEALPILVHNTDATFRAEGPRDIGDGEARARETDFSSSVDKGCKQREMTRMASARRPEIRRLRWGNATDAADVAQAAAAQWSCGRVGTEWQGFDIIVVSTCDPENWIQASVPLKFSLASEIALRLLQSF